MTLRSIVILLALTATATAQSPSGRHFSRDSRLPTTATSTPDRAVEASTPAPAARPLQKMRSGRAWPRFHFRRLPAPTTKVGTENAGTDVKIENASSRRVTPRSGFWGRRR